MGTLSKGVQITRVNREYPVLLVGMSRHAKSVQLVNDFRRSAHCHTGGLVAVSPGSFVLAQRQCLVDDLGRALGIEDRENVCPASHRQLNARKDHK